MIAAALLSGCGGDAITSAEADRMCDDWRIMWVVPTKTAHVFRSRPLRVNEVILDKPTAKRLVDVLNNIVERGIEEDGVEFSG